ncbi:orotate phosphoribosyltransferase [Dehalococcoidia bacterium]|nr:orotate phosphoribosyltransferase [Dehalococcoidia bacterium]MCL0076143.1 orotate phosphoribosyltransferase [Dehalococcoidia bacterium]MCL0102389.1 orotate phosphoribosyltransferase [Dehalococcoidia bacterium]
MATDIERLLELVKEKSFLYGDFTLSSGLKSSYYFDGRLTTLWPEGAYLVGKTVFELVKDAGIDAIGGPTMGADPIVAAVALVSHLEGKPIPAFMVRMQSKKHGAQRYIEGHLPSGGTVAIVDDVITTGGSVIRAIEAVEAEGCRVGRVVVLLDRNQGGADELRRRGYSFAALLRADEKGEVGAEKIP